jgi:hypothetical protein
MARGEPQSAVKPRSSACVIEILRLPFIMDHTGLTFVAFIPTLNWASLPQ